ncbi:allantoinase AllB [Nakamurella flavida]|uniref:allantoinase n=1 Tax=Nakamurella flavida TaxID=363630 RepID=A0A938YR17_9ACTN|nr:allantoinase AllB [Nakamurella flavida]MBM9477859.1 allantoinase AllB [Nakamurella flavida]MDP9779414.1 allantoinase [Nakamurella flavida]
MTDQLDLVIHADRAVLPDGEAAVTVGVRGGVIVSVQGPAPELTADRVVTLGPDEVLLPGLVDAHVHINDPGRSEWEGFRTATRAAAAGGVTTVIDMPLNSIPPTVDVAALEVKQQTAAGKTFVDVGFWGGAVPGNTADLRPLHEAGVFGFKCFLLHSGVDEFPALQGAELETDLTELAGLDAMMIIHAEDAESIDRAPATDGGRYQAFLESRPRGAENLAIAEVIELARWTGARVHILHLSSADALPMIRSARRDGVRITVETCPHYLTFAAEEIPDGATQFKCCPPIRESANRDELWAALQDGTIACIVSDHSPCTPELKRFDVGDFGLAWGGISSLQLGISAIWTQARERGIPLTDVVRWMAQAPAEHAGLTTKGRIAEGGAADFAVFAPEDTFTVDPAELFHRNAITPYAGRTLTGRVRSTYLAGRDISVDITTDGGRHGRLLRRGEA